MRALTIIAAAVAIWSAGPVFAQQNGTAPRGEGAYRDGATEGARQDGAHQDGDRGPSRDGGAGGRGGSLDRDAGRLSTNDAQYDATRDFRRDGTDPLPNPVSIDTGRSRHHGIGSRGGSVLAVPSSGPGRSPKGGPGAARLEPGGSDHGIDLRTPDGGFTGNATVRRHAEHKSLIPRPPKIVNPAATNVVRRAAVAPGAPLRDAIGALQPPGGAPGLPAHEQGVAALSSKVPVQAEGPTTSSGVPSGALGTGTGGGGAPRTVPVHIVPPNQAPNSAAINGTTIARLAAGSGMIGGQAKDRSGINGTTIRPRIH